jgi:hypothetical protein
MKRKEKKHPEITDAKELAKREEKNRFGTNAAKELDKQLKELQDFTNATPSNCDSARNETPESKATRNDKRRSFEDWKETASGAVSDRKDTEPKFIANNGTLFVPKRGRIEFIIRETKQRTTNSSSRENTTSGNKRSLCQPRKRTNKIRKSQKMATREYESRIGTFAQGNSDLRWKRARKDMKAPEFAIEPEKENGLGNKSCESGTAEKKFLNPRTRKRLCRSPKETICHQQRGKNSRKNATEFLFVWNFKRSQKFYPTMRRLSTERLSTEQS